MSKQQHIIEVENRLIGIPFSVYSGHVRTFKRAAIEPVACSVEHPDIEAGRVTINKRDLVVYRDSTSTVQHYWTTDLASVAKYARKRGA